MKRVGVIRGGAGEHYDSSIKKGGDIISHIFENLSDKYKVVDILIDREGVWHLNGLPIIPANLVHKVDVVWNTSHPSLSVTLNNFSIPSIADGSFSGALEKSHEMLKEHMAQIGVAMPRHIVFPVYQEDFDAPREKYSIKKAKEVHEKFGSPWVVRSFMPDVDMGVHLANTFNELVAAIEDGVNHQTSILVEEFISGKVASVHSVPFFRGQDLYIFPPVNVFGSLSLREKTKLMDLAEDLHSHLGAKHYLKSSFVMDKRGKVYLLGVNSKLDPRADSYFSKVCELVGTKVHHVVEHILGRAIR